MSEQGTVKWYSVAKGYGFIRGDEGESAGVDIFVHYSDISTSTLNEGERVNFEIVSSPKGLKARNVTLTEGVEA